MMSSQRKLFFVSLVITFLFSLWFIPLSYFSFLDIIKGSKNLEEPAFIVFGIILVVALLLEIIKFYKDQDNLKLKNASKTVLIGFFVGILAGFIYLSSSGNSWFGYLYFLSGLSGVLILSQVVSLFFNFLGLREEKNK